jgi:hypothetical protein
MAQIPPFEETVLRAICNILGDTSDGLTGSEIGQLLRDCGIEDPLAGYTKRERLFEALYQRQRKDGVGNQVVAFIYKAMNPVRYIREPHVFESRRSQLNQGLAFAGLILGKDGRLQRTSTVRTLTEAQERAGNYIENS